MPAKFKPSTRKYVRGKATKNMPMEHFYLKNTPKEELFNEINKYGVKPKQKIKCIRELIRRGIKIEWVSKEANNG
jgi:hypothetical protein